MNDKYYTPSIEDFHVGFECEFALLYQDSVEDEPWYKINIENEKYIEPNMPSLKYRIEKEAVRVKYLDKEDIESLGFEGNDINTVYFTKKACLTSNGTNFLDCRLVHWPMIDCRELDIYAVYGKEDEQLIFRGIIKNKSELKVLLKQLGIDVLD